MLLTMCHNQALTITQRKEIVHTWPTFGAHENISWYDLATCWKIEVKLITSFDILIKEVSRYHVEQRNVNSCVAKNS